jgi:hypothetical protein
MSAIDMRNFCLPTVEYEVVEDASFGWVIVNVVGSGPGLTAFKFPQLNIPLC